MKIKLSKNQWENMGKKAGWIKEGQSAFTNTIQQHDPVYDLIEKLFVEDNAFLRTRFMFHKQTAIAIFSDIMKKHKDFADKYGKGFEWLMGERVNEGKNNYYSYFASQNIKLKKR